MLPISSKNFHQAPKDPLRAACAAYEFGSWRSEKMPSERPISAKRGLLIYADQPTEVKLTRIH